MAVHDRPLEVLIYVLCSEIEGISMQWRFSSLVLFVLVILISGIPLSSIAASEIIKQTPTKKTKPIEKCKKSETALDAIHAATIASNKKGRPVDVQDLIYQADVAASVPECNSVRAKVLAGKAKQLADEKAESPFPEPSPSRSSKLSNSTNSKFGRNYTRCLGEMAIYGLLPIIAVGADGIGLGIFTTATGAVFCVPAAGMAVSMEASMKQSVEASFRKSHAAYRKTEQQRFIVLTREHLIRDMARGGGEYLTAMAYLEGCPIEIHGNFAKMTQRNFMQIVPQTGMGVEAILHNLEVQIAEDPMLVANCHSVS